MALTNAYLVASKNLAPFLAAVRGARAPEKFTMKFLEDLGFKSTNDRLLIPLLKALGFLDENGVPLKRYFEFLDDGCSKRVLGEGIQAAYEDLFRLNKNAHTLSSPQIVGKLKSLTEGKKSDPIIRNMARTFSELVKLAEFSNGAKPGEDASPQRAEESETSAKSDPPIEAEPPRKGIPSNGERRGQRERLLDGIVYRIEIVLPSVRDQAVYDAIFRSLKEHLL
jgi:hypothetical protein